MLRFVNISESFLYILAEFLVSRYNVVIWYIVASTDGTIIMILY